MTRNPSVCDSSILSISIILVFIKHPCNNITNFNHTTIFVDEKWLDSSANIFELEEDVLDFETESLDDFDGGGEGGCSGDGGAEAESEIGVGGDEDLLQLHDSDSDSLEKLMEDIEKELSAPIQLSAPVKLPSRSLKAVSISKQSSGKCSSSMWVAYSVFCALFSSISVIFVISRWSCYIKETKVSS